MKKHFNYNFTEKEIIGSKAAINRANKGMNPEYAELSEMLAAHPNFTVRAKDIQQNKRKKTYSELTLNRMKEYIRTQFADEKVLNAKLVEFSAIQKVAETKGAKYPLTKKWFLATYPSFKENEVSGEEMLAAEAERKAEALLASFEAANEEMANVA